jgi:hypothetical protein
MVIASRVGAGVVWSGAFRGRFFRKQASEQGRKGEEEGRRRLILR